MSLLEGEALYRKVGRKYIPVGNSMSDSYDRDLMKIGEFRLVFCSGDGERRYQHGVTPDTAGWHAAAMIAHKAIKDAIKEAAVHKPQLGRAKAYTKKQIALIEEFRKSMVAAGGFMPDYWQSSSPYDIADAAIKAVANYGALFAMK